VIPDLEKVKELPPPLEETLVTRSMLAAAFPIAVIFGTDVACLFLLMVQFPAS
jgi:hypothetical protein